MSMRIDKADGLDPIDQSILAALDADADAAQSEGA
jgi:hypothetical protein